MFNLKVSVTLTAALCMVEFGNMGFDVSGFQALTYFTSFAAFFQIICSFSFAC